MLPIVCFLGLAEQGAQRKINGLSRVSQLVSVYYFLDQIDVYLDLDLLPHGLTIPSAEEIKRLLAALVAKVCGIAALRL
jgi:hypothetical protein